MTTEIEAFYQTWLLYDDGETFQADEPEGFTQEQVEHYIDCRQKGTTPSLAEMLALGVTPFLNTDAVFLAGRSCNGSQFEGNKMMQMQGDYYKKVAESKGQSTTGKVYIKQLAAYAGDPEAWVSGRGDVVRVCKARNWDCEGSVNVKTPPPVAPKPYKKAPKPGV